jgi:hypothetical protein
MPNSDPTPVPAAPPTPPGYVTDDIQTLLNQLTAPETQVVFGTSSNPPSRADTTTIKDSINPAVQAWTWANNYAQTHQQVTAADVGKFGYQVDIDSYFRLDAVDASNTPSWTPVSDPDATSNAFELSNGASDAVAFHDFYRLQIAFEDVWAELVDKRIGTTAEAFYAQWDALINAGGGNVNDEPSTAQIDAIYAQLQAAQTWLSEVNSTNSLQILPLATADLTISDQAAVQLQTSASDAFKNAFGLDLKNLHGKLQSALSGVAAIYSSPGYSAPVIDAVNAAMEIVVGVQDRLPQARIATFNAPSQGDIGGYDALEHFLNDVRTILDLPTVPPPQPMPAGISDMVVALGQAIESLSSDYRTFFNNTIQELDDNDAWKAIADTSMTYQASLNNTIDTINDLINACTASGAGFSIATISQIVNNIRGVLNGTNGVFIKAATELRSGANVGPVKTDIVNADTSANMSGLLDSLSTNFPAVQASLQNTGSGDSSSNTGATDVDFPELETLFYELSNMLKERYSFDVFAPASINYGLLLNYRQRWAPQSYQVGNLAATIPLAPGETRKYTTKKVVKKSRNRKALDESLHSDKEDSSKTQRDDAEIFADANQQTSFGANASGTFKIGVYDVHADTHLNQNQAATSKNTKRGMREYVMKSAQEYRDQHRTEIEEVTSTEDETTSSREIRNPNDELTVTYLFYELQRRYLVTETLHRALPVVLVANDVPAPQEVDEAWLLRHDWILKRVILDDSFLPALTYLAGEFAGRETALIIQELEVQHQKNIVDQLSRQVELANQALNAATAGVVNAENWSLNDQRNQEYVAIVKTIFDPLNIGQVGKVDDGNSDRARIDFANEAMQRAQAKVNDLSSQMKTELTVLQAAIDKYTAAATVHYAMQAQINRLRLHVKDNIIYYMQAIWAHEPADQRYFRLYNLDVPVFESDATVDFDVNTGGGITSVLSAADTNNRTIKTNLPKPTLSNDTKKLHQIADIDQLLGFKGNYMMFPLTDFNNYMTWYLIQNHIHLDPTAGLVFSDPDPDADIPTPDKLEEALKAIHAQNPDSFAAHESDFEAAMLQLLSNQVEQMVIVPSDQLYIEALPGTHPILEDFKLMHRALDVKKVQAEVRKAELENLRLAARLASGEYGDPDIEKKIVIEGGVPVSVSPGD